MTQKLDTLLKMLWEDYAMMNRQAGCIHEALEAQGERVVNDHVAFRTFNHPKTGINVMAQPFLDCGYQLKGEGYRFEEKKLIARHFEHPSGKRPKIFISALKVEEFSAPLQKTVFSLIRRIPDHYFDDPKFLISGACWGKIDWQTYSDLLKESEYAAWMSVFGFRVNHFTVFANALKTLTSMKELNDFIRALGFELNCAGGEIKGTPAELLEQSSTMAYPVEVAFSDRTETIPGCYYEFARRYPQENGKLFQGFLPKSADKIFESTNVRKKDAL